MRIAVISDIHANLAALEAALAAVDEEQPDEIWCLGDTVGYGPRPNECCALVAARADLCLVGNHDLAVLGAVAVDDFNDDAAAAVTYSRDELSHESRAFLQSLRPSAERAGVELFHASPVDPVWQYVLDPYAALDALEATAARVVLVGHSHVALEFHLREGVVGGSVVRGGTTLELGSGRSLLNPGSVGQPRDADARAAYLLLDLDARFAHYRRVAYPVERTQVEIRERGLPESLARRLEFGQ